MSNYYHLSPEERAVIMIEYPKGNSIRKISKLLNRSASTISREIKRNHSKSTNRYCATNAFKQYTNRRKRCLKSTKLNVGSDLYNKVKFWIVDKKWSPEQISDTL